MANYADLIHAAIVDVVEAHRFPIVKYKDARTRSTTKRRALPKTIKTDQQSSAFVPATQNRQRRFNERAAWTWILDLHFDVPVSLEEFEDSLAQNPLRIARDTTDGRPQQVDIFLEEAEEYVHPPRRSPSTGTRVRYRLVAELTPL